MFGRQMSWFRAMFGRQMSWFRAMFGRQMSWFRAILGHTMRSTADVSGDGACSGLSLSIFDSAQIPFTSSPSDEHQVSGCVLAHA